MWNILLWRTSTHNMRLWKKPEVENEKGIVDLGCNRVLGIGCCVPNTHNLSHPNPRRPVLADAGTRDHHVRILAQKEEHAGTQHIASRHVHGELPDVDHQHTV